MFTAIENQISSSVVRGTKKPMLLSSRPFDKQELYFTRFLHVEFSQN